MLKVKKKGKHLLNDNIRFSVYYNSYLIIVYNYSIYIVVAIIL
jgi:hypothetical protein